MKQTSREAGHETTDAEVRPLALFGAALVGLAVLVMILSRVILGGLDARAKRSDAARRTAEWPAEPPPGPRLQADPRAEMDEFRAVHAARAASYEWVDREAGVVQVPIERALELVLERGLPVRGAAAEGER